MPPRRHAAPPARYGQPQPAPDPSPDTVTLGRLTDTGELKAIARWGHETRAAYHADTNLWLRGLFDRFHDHRKAVSQ